MSAISALADAGIHADRDGLHVMPPEQLQGAVSMQEECKEFLAKTKQTKDEVVSTIHPGADGGKKAGGKDGKDKKPAAASDEGEVPCEADEYLKQRTYLTLNLSLTRR